jgi:hypothetical protein
MMRVWACLCLACFVVLLAACGSLPGMPEAAETAEAPAAAAATDGTEPTPTRPDAEPTTPTEPSTPAEPTPALTLGEEQEVAEAGYAFQPLEDWAVESQLGVVGMRPPDADPQGGPSIAITVGRLERLYIEGVSSSSIASSEDLLDAIIAGIERETMNLDMSEPQEMTVDDVPALVVGFESTGFGDIEREVAGRLGVALVDETRGMLMFGLATPPDRWQHDGAFDAVLQNLRFLAAPPTPEPTATLTPAPTDTPDPDASEGSPLTPEAPIPTDE